MRKVFLSLATVLASSSLMVGAAAALDPVCTLQDSGPDSYNECEVTSNNTTTIHCNNELDVVIINNQKSASGDATIDNNTNGGSATSGDVENSNDTAADVDVSCGPKVETEEAEETPAPVVAAVVTPPAPTGGQGQAQAQAPKVQALPETGNNSAITLATIATVTVGLASAAARFGFSAYKSLQVCRLNS
jgi:hypothetical protein